MNILVVDDVAINRKLLRASLEVEGHEILEAADGQEALLVLRREKVDAVISDVLMPKMDGFRLCMEIRKDEKLRSLPFVIYTSTYTSPQDVTLARTVGADRYITKPAKTETIMAALSEAVQKQSHSVPPGVGPEETDVLKQYNQALVNKLEEKNTDLQYTVQALQRAHERILELNELLEKKVAERTAELSRALADVKELTGLLPICSYCKKVRDGDNYWEAVKSYITKHSKAQVSPGFCPDCYQAHLAPRLEALRTPPPIQAPSLLS